MYNLLQSGFRDVLIKHKNIMITKDKRGVRLQLGGEVMFQPGDTKLRSEATRLLKKLLPIIKSTTYKVMVEGHTDNMPIANERFGSNWELSSLRAVRVLRYFTDEAELEPKNFSGALGCADVRGIYPNDTPENRAKIRRVDNIFEIF
ncbi:MAG: OmpA family protein [bacterium]|nr:OmpA family protein [bacterium]